MRQVVVTGLGAITPLGLGISKSLDKSVILPGFAGVKRTWNTLLRGECGIRSLRDHGPTFESLQCRVAGLVPTGSKASGGWDAAEWLSRDVGLSAVKQNPSS